MYDVAIIGGGAAGLVCAVAVCERAIQTDRPVPRILILEAADKIGRSILRSGNGRCNFSNADIRPSAYRDPESFRQVASASCQCFSSSRSGNPVVEFFERLGLLWREESEGRLYPLANKASVVLDVLRSPLHRFGAEIRTEAFVERIVVPQAKHSHFTLHLRSGELVRAHSAVVAVGGAAGPLGLEELLPYVEPMPILGPLATDDRFTRPLDNIRLRCSVSLLREGRRIAEERGEVLFRKYGVSGIAIFNLSRFAQKGDIVRVNMLPDVVDPVQLMLARLQELGHALDREPSNFEVLQGAVLPLIADQVLKSLGMESMRTATEDGAKRMAERMCAFDLSVRGIGDEGLCQVHRGGFGLDAFYLDTMESKAIPGLHVLGEALDQDAPCGGYNLHWAFATGMLAAQHIVERWQRTC